MRVFCLLLLFLFATSAQASAVHDAARSGDITALQNAIAAGEDVNSKEGNQTALNVAVQGGHIEAVRLLLKSGADPDQPAGFGYPLKTAMLANRSDIIEILLKGGANPNIERQSVTALHTAAELGCFDCVVLLVNDGADVNARTSSNTPVIHYAKSNGHQKIVDYLLDHGVRLATPAPIAPLLPSSNLEHGKAVFGQSCKACHEVDLQSDNPDHPQLWNVVGRKRGTLDFKYSDAMREVGGTWGYEEIGAFIADPVGVIPGTRMTFSGLTSDRDRADVVLYLRSLSDHPMPMP